MNIKIGVAAHKPYWMPQDPMYIPLQVGAKGKEPIPGFRRDDEGRNISSKNPRYCELTALYWMWKNLDADYIGLAHYRRHFKGCGERETLTHEEADHLLSEAPLILPKKRNYYIETIESHYAHTFDIGHLQVLRDVIKERSPEALSVFDAHMQEKSAHIWNMAIMSKSLLDDYCEWLFPILEEVEERIDFTGMSPFEERVIGRLSERLLDPWVRMNDVGYTELPVVGMEKTNWARKGTSFLAAKFGGKRYAESF